MSLCLLSAGDASLPPPEPSSEGKTGYWGSPTSTIDWCEPNYQVTTYLAEFVNSTSSLIIVFFGLLGFYANYHKNHLLLRHLEARMLITYGLLALIGIGSFMFHGTLLFEFQLLDELPMIYIALSLAYCVTEDRRKKRFRYLAPLFVFAAIFMTVFYIKVPSVYLFENVYGIIIIYGIIRVGLWSFMSTKSDYQMKSVYIWAVVLFGSGFVAWNLDNHFCSSIGWMYLHGWWHFGTGSGAYHLFVAIEYHRSKLLRENPIVVRSRIFFGLPMVLRAGMMNSKDDLMKDARRTVSEYI